MVEDCSRRPVSQKVVKGMREIVRECVPFVVHSRHAKFIPLTCQYLSSLAPLTLTASYSVDNIVLSLMRKKYCGAF